MQKSSRNWNENEIYTRNLELSNSISSEDFGSLTNRRRLATLFDNYFVKSGEILCFWWSSNQGKRQAEFGLWQFSRSVDSKLPIFHIYSMEGGLGFLRFKHKYFTVSIPFLLLFPDVFISVVQNCSTRNEFWASSYWLPAMQNYSIM